MCYALHKPYHKNYLNCFSLSYYEVATFYPHEKIDPRTAKQLSQGHRATQQGSQNLNISLNFKTIPTTTPSLKTPVPSTSSDILRFIDQGMDRSLLYFVWLRAKIDFYNFLIAGKKFLKDSIS